MYDQEAVNKLICKLLDINFVKYQQKVSKGMRPVKAAIFLGAPVTLAEAVAPLQIAITAEDINYAYTQKNALSCMSNELVGAYYELNNISCLWTPNFRVLYNQDSKTFLGRSYGTHRDIILELLQQHYKVSLSDFLKSENKLKEIIVTRDPYTSSGIYLKPEDGYNLRRRISIYHSDDPGKNYSILSVPVSVQKAVHKLLAENLTNEIFEVYQVVDKFNINIWRYWSETIYNKPFIPAKVKLSRQKVFQTLKDLPKEDNINRNEPYADYFANPLLLEILEHNKTIEELPYDVEEHYLKHLGDSYRDPMPRSRTNYDRKYTRGKHVN